MHDLDHRSAASADVVSIKPPLLIHYAEDNDLNAGGAAYEASTGGSSLVMA